VTLRRRFALVAAVAVAVTIVVASGIVYVVVRGELRGRVDAELRQTAERRLPLAAALHEEGAGGPLGGLRLHGGGGDASGSLSGGPPGAAGPLGHGGRGPLGGASPDAAPAGAPALPPPRDALGLPTAYLAVVDSGGAVLVPAGGDSRLPVTAATRAVAAGTRGELLSDATVAGQPVRVLTRPLPGGLALQIARPLGEVNRTLDRLALVLILVSGGGIALAAVLGRLAARTALTPVAQLTGTVEHVAQTTDLTQRIELDGARDDDELSRLARSFNVMLAALESSIGRQRQLVADASHELRTPLTSLRTNVEVLARDGNGAAAPLPNGDRPALAAAAGARPALSPTERRRVLADVVEQLDELSGLVGDLVELAREEEPAAETEDVRFDELVEAALDRAGRRPGAPAFDARLDPCLVRGVPARLDRAVANLLDNAAKWSPPGGTSTRLAASSVARLREQPTLPASLPGTPMVEVALHNGELTVRDHGPGIAESDLPYVFERFYRAPSARGMPGSGLGLAIVRQVAELHGGSVEARSAPGGGALLRLTLPAEPVDTKADLCQLPERLDPLTTREETSACQLYPEPPPPATSSPQPPGAIPSATRGSSG
jgi:two-component system, OmpR family, sensor histidine kinase MprB